jgi:hypothetical protein
MPFDPAGHELRVEALEKIERVIDLINERGRWCKGTFKTGDGRMCILGAVREADAELLLYAPILRAIRGVTGHGYRRIEAFNDEWLTDHRLVLEVLEQVRRDLTLGLVPAAGRPEAAAPPPRWNWLRALGRRSRRR